MIDKIEKKLNKEYKYFGSIEISELHLDIVDVDRINYVGVIMDSVEPITVDEPIILAEDCEAYFVIDGYHRLKNKILNREKTIKCIILDEYIIKRKNDRLLHFIESLIGKTIMFISDTVFVMEGAYYVIEENEGCRGCSNGWSKIEVLPQFIYKKIKIKSVMAVEETEGDDIYDLIINDNVVAKVNTGWGNGYYGGDFNVGVVI